MKNVKKLTLLLLMCCISIYSMAQTVVSGKVVSSADNSGLAGVNVTVKGSALGTATDADGNFSVTIPTDKAVLIFNYLGFKDQQVSVSGSRKDLKVEMSENTQLLDEVVVTAYGTAKRPTLTTSQIGVTAKQMSETVNTTLEQAIQGRAAGVMVTQNSGQPGGAISVNIRGISSITGTTQPLYVIDGVQIQGNDVTSTGGNNPLSGLNPSDIADMQILQGPSASALYGSKATNGVILITTKRGKAGSVRINYQYQLSEQTRPKHLDMMDLQQYATFANGYPSVGTSNVPGQFLDPSLLGKGTDWQHELFRNVPMNKHSLSLSGGSDNLTYYLSGEYLNQQGVAQGSGFDRYGFRLNVDNKAYKWLTIGLNLSYSQTNENVGISTQDLISNALALTPQIPVKNIDGSWGGVPSNSPNTGMLIWAPVNPIAIAQLSINNNLQRQFMGGGNIQLDILPGLFFKASANTNLQYVEGTKFTPTYNIDQWHQNLTNGLRNDANNNTFWLINELLQYSKTIGNHYIEVMASHEAQEWTWKNIAASRSNFPANILDLNVGATTDASGVNSMTNSGGSGAGTMESYLGRINYNYAERYMLLGTIRTDGSSNFGINNRWGTFPSVSAAWRISKEPWYNIKFLNEAKLRFETGTTGNSGSGGVYATMTAGPTPFGGSGFLLNQYANPDLKWESTVSYNGGLNLGFFKNRIQLEADYYVRNTSNLLMQAPVPNYMGVSGTGSIRAPQINFGSIQNKGWAFTLNTTNIDTKEFTWTSNFNISGVRPVVTQLNTNSAQASRTVNGLNNVMQVCQIGKAPWLFYGYIQEGYFTSVADVENSARPVDNTGTPYPADVDASKGIWVGDIKYKDISGPDGKPDGKITTQDQTVIGNPWPKFFGGFTNTFSYKGLDLNILLTYSSGNSILNYQAFMATGPNNFYVGRNYLAGVTDYAQIGTDGDGNPYLVNPNAFVPRITTTGDKDVNGNYNRITTRWIEDGSYIRVKNISLSYSLPKTLLYKTKFITGLRLTFSAQNVLTFTKYTGFDPEVGTYVGSSVYGSGNQLIGVDYNHYPLSPIYTFSVNVNL